MTQKFVHGATIDLDLYIQGNPRSYVDVVVASVGGGYLEIVDATGVNRVFPWYQVVNVILK